MKPIRVKVTNTLLVASLHWLMSIILGTIPIVVYTYFPGKLHLLFLKIFTKNSNMQECIFSHCDEMSGFFSAIISFFIYYGFVCGAHRYVSYKNKQHY